jgi:hypothetical protein
MIRLMGAFGFQTVEEEIVEVNKYDGFSLKTEQIRNKRVNKYKFKSGYYPDWVHSLLKNYAFVSNSLIVTTYNKLDKHRYAHKAIVKDSTGYAPDYTHLNKKWYKVEVDFKDKYDDTGFRKNCAPSGINCEPVNILNEDGETVDTVPAGGDYVIPASGSPATVSNSDNTFSENVSCGSSLELEDYTINVYVNGALNQTATSPSMVDLTINISV